MVFKRVIPVLLLKDLGLVKTVKFKSPIYIGDPINAVKIFNEKEVDELILLDIEASKYNREPNYKLISDIGSEAFIPFGYGGGINRLDQVKKIMFAGAEKVILNTICLNNPDFISEVASYIGSSSTVASIDIKKDFWGRTLVYDHVNAKCINIEPKHFGKQLENCGAGELFINFVDNDGMMNGYNTNVLNEIAENVSIPVVGCGGAGNFDHIKSAFEQNQLSGVGAGSIFVFHGKHKAVLISYLSKSDIAILNKNT